MAFDEVECEMIAYLAGIRADGNLSLKDYWEVETQTT
jgi:hypothetical protein